MTSNVSALKSVVSVAIILIAANVYLAVCFCIKTSTTIGAESIAMLAFIVAAGSATFFFKNRSNGLFFRSLFAATSVLGFAWLILAAIGSVMV
jgi:hypothetical protein